MKMAADNAYRLLRRSNSSPGLSGAEVITAGRFERACPCMHQSSPAIPDSPSRGATQPSGEHNPDRWLLHLTEDDHRPCARGVSTARMHAHSMDTRHRALGLRGGEFVPKGAYRSVSGSC